LGKKAHNSQGRGREAGKTKKEQSQAGPEARIDREKIRGGKKRKRRKGDIKACSINPVRTQGQQAKKENVRMGGATSENGMDGPGGNDLGKSKNGRLVKSARPSKNLQKKKKRKKKKKGGGEKRIRMVILQP